MTSSTPKHLYACESVATQLAWIERALRAGRTLSDSGLWLGGVNRPESLIARLRKAGLSIETTKKKVLDAADEEHDDLAWRLAPAG